MANSYIFNQVERFADGNGAQLKVFLTQFDRCCAVANKVDGDVPVKGTLLMLYLEGRAKAAMEEYVLTLNGVDPTYAQLVPKLKEYFDSTSSKQISMTQFEERIQAVNESEEQFMHSLLQLYN